MSKHRLSELTALVAQARADLDIVAERLAAAHRQLHDAQPGVRSVPTDAAGTVHGGDPVPAAAAARTKDPAVAALDDLADWIHAIRQRSRPLATLVVTWSAKPTTAGAGMGEPGCQIMAKHGGPWEEARYSVDIAGVRWRVGQRTYRWYKETGELPTVDVVRAWAQGRVPKRRAA
jgi:hypothetical protein